MTPNFETWRVTDAQVRAIYRDGINIIFKFLIYLSPDPSIGQQQWTFSPSFFFLLLQYTMIWQFLRSSVRHVRWLSLRHPMVGGCRVESLSRYFIRFSRVFCERTEWRVLTKLDGHLTRIRTTTALHVSIAMKELTIEN